MNSECTISVEESGQAWGRLATRNPENGTRRISGEVYLSPQGEADGPPLPFYSFQKAFPQASQQLCTELSRLESERRDALRMEFVLAGQTLHLSGIASLIREPKAAVKIAVSLVEEGVLTAEEALGRVLPEDFRRMLLPSFHPTEVRKSLRQGHLIATGRGVFGGATSGIVARDTKSVWEFRDTEQDIILVCPQLSQLERKALPLISGLIVAGGPTLSAFQYELPCVVLPEMPSKLQTGDKISLDAGTGQIFEGVLKQLPGELNADALTLLKWADEIRKIDVRANVENVEDVKMAMAFGATGVGLCRIEALFLKTERLPLFQHVLKEVCVEKQWASDSLDELTSEISDDVYELLMAGTDLGEGSFTVRLLDAPVAQMLGYWRDSQRLPTDYFQPPMSAWLEELNPMQGLRCGRLSLMYPKLMELQLQALLRASNRARSGGMTVELQVMMPGVTDVAEIRLLRERMKSVADDLGLEPLQVGSMLELPRACLTAARLAEQADFLSFGTGDLTESTCGMSRYDSQLSFLHDYLEQGIFEKDPFQSIDQAGVGVLMELAVRAVHDKCPTVELGICGAQAIEAESLEFCRRIGLRYISVPVHHLPVSRLAAARAELACQPHAL